MFESTCGNAVDHENDDDHHNYEQPLGKGGATKSDEFLEKCQRGRGHFQSIKFMLQIWGTLNRAF